MPLPHLKPLGDYETDYVAVAERFLGVPYLWGGKTALGLDCSGLVQVSLTACGIACPRDSDMQDKRRSVRHLPSEQRSSAAISIFWKGHVAIVRDAASMIHANAFHMAVAIEPIAEALSRIRAAGSEVTAVQALHCPGVLSPSVLAIPAS